MGHEAQSKNQEAYRLIKNLIIDQKFFPGQKLIYRDLEEKLSMSKTPIINGLVMLEREGFVEAKKNRGFYVCDATTDENIMIIDLKAKLEEIAVEYAIEHYTNGDLVILKEKMTAYDQYECQYYDRKRLFLDTDFHIQIVKMGKNRFLTSTMQMFYENIYFRIKVAFLAQYLEKFRNDHKRIFESIEKKNLETAKKILRGHTEVVINHLKNG